MPETTYRVRVERSLDDDATAQIRAAGLTVPALDDGSLNEFTATVTAPREGLAVTRAMNEAMRAGMTVRGHMLRCYDADTGAEMFTSGKSS